MPKIKLAPSEGELLGSMHPSSWVVPQELPVKTKKSKQILNIGVPKESHLQEYRVPLTPESAGVLVANGHCVYVEQGAGDKASFSDKQYSDVGAQIVYKHEDIFTKADVIVKISPLTKGEQELLRQNQTLISAVNLGSQSPEYLKNLIRKNISAVGFEFLQSKDGSLPLVQMMSEIAGVTSIHIASELLSEMDGGKGMLLGGITGVPPAIVTIIGAGTVGLHAARTAIGMGAMVKIIDKEVFKLRKLERDLGMNVFTAISQQNYIEDAVHSSDVIIGSAHIPGHRAPIVVTEDMILQMKEGSVIVDVAIDQGGCIETSKVTTHESPTFTEHDIIHYCVPNIASRVPNTASAAIANILSPLLIDIGDSGGIKNVIRHNDTIRQGLYVYKKHLTKQPIASLFGMDFMNINLLAASEI